MGTLRMVLTRGALLLFLALLSVGVSAQGDEPDGPDHHIGCGPAAKKQCWHAYKRICIKYGYNVCPLETSTKPPGGIIQQKIFCWLSVNRVYKSARKMIKFTQLCFCEPKNCNPYQGSTEDVNLVEAADTYEEYKTFVEAANQTNIVTFQS